MNATQNLSVFLHEDDPGYAYLIERSLRSIPSYELTYSRLCGPEGLVDRRTRGPVDLFLLACGGDGAGFGLEILRRLREAGDETPVVMTLRRRDTALARRCLRLGADGTLPKSELSPARLADAIRTAFLRLPRAVDAPREPVGGRVG